MALPLIQKNVPIPEKAKYKNYNSRMYGFNRLDVGDSFFVPNAKKGTLKNAYSGFIKKDPFTLWDFFVDDVEEEDPETKQKVKGARIWRLEDKKKDAPLSGSVKGMMKEANKV